MTFRNQGRARLPLASFALAAALVLGAADARAARHPAFGARAGLAQAEAAAQVWASDAALVYVENDEDVDATGVATRWGYLFYSAARQQARGYSVRDGRVVVAQDLDMKFEAPPVAPQWIDSEAALRQADEHGGGKYCREHSGRVSTLLLTRGPFQPGDPDDTTWTVVYTSAGAPSLFVVVDAAQGRVRRTWRG